MKTKATHLIILLFLMSGCGLYQSVKNTSVQSEKIMVGMTIQQVESLFWVWNAKVETMTDHEGEGLLIKWYRINLDRKDKTPYVYRKGKLIGWGKDYLASLKKQKEQSILEAEKREQIEREKREQATQANTSINGSELSEKDKSVEDRILDPDRQLHISDFLKITAIEGDVYSQYELGRIYYFGKGVSIDYTEAAKWYQLAADSGYAPAQNMIGYLYESGKGYAQNYAEAKKWYQIAAEQGYDWSQFSLGKMYYYGWGVPQSYAEAARWAHMAAMQGHAPAQLQLGWHYSSGKGVPQDYVESHMWYNLSASQGNEEALERRDILSRHMTGSQLEEAQTRARNFKPVVGGADDGSPGASEHLEISATGTGFFINDVGYILTNDHVVNSCRAIQIRLGNTSPIRVNAIHRNAEFDLAVLYVDPEKAKHAIGWSGLCPQFRSGGEPPLGEVAVVYGYPLIGALSSGGNITTGNISALTGPGDDRRLYQMSSPVQQGNSGGPLFDNCGNIIGVVVSKLDALKVVAMTGDIPQNVNFAVKGTIVKNFLSLYQIPFSQAPSKENFNKKATDIARSAKKYTVIIECLE
jgi:hypothetical protein